MKSGYVLQTVLLERESKGQHASSSTGGNRKQHQVSRYFKTVNSGFVQESGYVTAKSYWDPASEKLMCLSNFMLVVLQYRCIDSNNCD